ncbi:MAG TPA: hypothetical protein VFL91_30150 [Thermomicrobiales bacterium]|nr:hypothetical protein [Thermomicrobiales bacterium]
MAGVRLRAGAGWPALLTALYGLAAVVATWPLAARAGDGVVSPIDPVDGVWRVGWAQQALLHRPWALFDAPVFYPFPHAYLFDELLFGSALLTLPLRLVTANPVLLYNLAVLANLVLSALAMFALARRLGAGRVGAFAAGLIYAFAPLHLAHIGHLGLLASGWFPLAILLLDRLFATPRWRDALALAAVLALQALSAQYYALYLVPVVGGFVALRTAQLARRRRFPGPAVWGRLLAAGALAALPVLPFALGYRQVQGDYAVARTIAQNAHYSANVLSFFTADGQNLVWGRVTAPLRAYGTYTFERNMFPGLVALLLAAVGLAVAWRRPLAQYLALLALGSAILALGPHLYLTADPKSQVFAYLPYRWLYYHAPGVSSMRVPARIGVLFLLGVAGLAALGLDALLRRARAWRPPRARALAGLVAAVAIGAIALESLNAPFTFHSLPTGDRLPAVYTWLAAQPPGVVLELPLVIPDHDRELTINNRFEYFGLYHHHRLINGSANVVPKGYRALYEEWRRGPTARALAIAQGLGVAYVVVHADLLDADRAAFAPAAFRAFGDQATPVATFGPDAVYQVRPAGRFAELRALIPRDATVYLSRADPAGTGAYAAMLGRVLRGNRLYTRLRVAYDVDYAGTPTPGAAYDYAVLYRGEDPAAAGFAGATVVWQDDVVRVYRRGG